MDVEKVLADKHLKAKGKVGAISKMLLNGDVCLADVIEAAKSSTASDKGTCIEAIEFATKARPEIASPYCLKFVADSLLDKAPRVKWESPKTVGNIAHLYPDKLDRAI